MKFYRIAKVEPKAFPILKLTFEDGFEGELEVSASLRAVKLSSTEDDQHWFANAEIMEDGRALCWNVGADRLELCADALRYALEEQVVRERAKQFENRVHAAE